MLDKTEQSDRAPNPNEKPESCYCSALPKGSGPCLPCYTRWLAGSARKESGLALPSFAVDDARPAPSPPAKADHRPANIRVQKLWVEASELVASGLLPS
jgi:hypothetical protein